MKRSTFIKNMIGFYGISSLPVEMIKQYQKIYLLQCFVRGFQFYEGPNLIRQINMSGLLEMVREPNNKYDSSAIALHFNNNKIGFIPAESNQVLARIMDAKLIPLQAEITHVEPEAAAWENVHVAIYALKEMKPTDLDKDYSKFGILETPEYYTLKSSEDTYARLYVEDDPYENYTDYYEQLIENSQDNSVYDLIHGSFKTPEDFSRAFDQSKLIIKRKLDKAEGLVDQVTQSVHDTTKNLEDAFDDKGYVAANIDQIARIPYRIEKFVEVLDKAGNKFYEVIFKDI